MTGSVAPFVVRLASGGALLLALTAPGALAADVKVLAGEHGAYSRLVVPGAAADAVVRDGERRLFIPLSAENDYDLSDAAKARKAHRVTGASIVDGADGRRLILDLSCPCTYKATPRKGGGLILDIFDAKRGVASAVAPKAGASDTPSANSVARNGTETAPGAKATAQPATSAQFTAEPGDQSRREERVSAARERLLSLLTNASQRGAVALRNDTPAAQRAKGSGEKPATNGEARSAPADDVDLAPTTAALTRCPSGGATAALLTGAGDITFGEVDRLIEAAKNTTEEERGAAQRALSLGYLNLGFFAEAGAAAHNEDGPDNAFLAELAELAAGRGAPQAFAKIKDCNSLTQLLHAAASRAGPTGVNLELFKLLPNGLAAPLAERLAVDAVNREDLDGAKQLADIASKARGGERSAALEYLSAAFDESAAAREAASKEGEARENAGERSRLADIAERDGPLQTEALARLAETSPMPGADLLDALAAHGPLLGADAASSRAAASGAKLLAEHGRVGDAIDLLRDAARAAPNEASRFEDAARAVIIDTLESGQPTARIAAAESVFEDADFIGPLSDAARAGVLDAYATLGLSGLAAARLAARADGAAQNDKSAEMRMITRLRINAGDNSGAYAAAMRNPKDPDLAKLGLVALRRLGDDEAVEGALERTAQRKVATPAIAEEAFYAEAWPLTRRLFALIPKDARTEDAARLALVAAVADGLKEAPAEALAMFEQDDPRRRALAHMFERAPAFNPTDPEPMQRYAARVADEVDFIRTELFE